MKRRDNESMGAYRARRAADQASTKQKLQGTVLWDSSKKGTYKRKDHGPLGGEVAK